MAENLLFDPLVGVIICGGKSTRMGLDKAFMDYHGKEQCYHLYELLLPFCKSVYISCNEQQAKTLKPQYQKICDAKEFENKGPMAALLSLEKSIHSQSFLILACDYPFINKESIETLIQGRLVNGDALCFYNEEENILEPLLAIYEKKCISRLIRFYNQGNYSLRDFLKSINAKKIKPAAPDTLFNVNSMEDYRRTIQKLKP